MVEFSACVTPGSVMGADDEASKFGTTFFRIEVFAFLGRANFRGNFFGRANFRNTV